MQTKVIYRKWIRGGEIIALFPELPGTSDADSCLSYEHFGQHGTSDAGLSRVTVPARPEEYAALAKELRAIGYELTVIKRFRPAHRAARGMVMAAEHCPESAIACCRVITPTTVKTESR